RVGTRETGQGAAVEAAYASPAGARLDSAGGGAGDAGGGGNRRPRERRGPGPGLCPGAGGDRNRGGPWPAVDGPERRPCRGWLRVVVLWTARYSAAGSTRWSGSGPSYSALPARGLLRCTHCCGMWRRQGFPGRPACTVSTIRGGRFSTLWRGQWPPIRCPRMRAGMRPWPLRGGWLLRRYHDATVGFVPPRDAVWQLPERAPREVICHGDVAPYNTVFPPGCRWRSSTSTRRIRGRVSGISRWPPTGSCR